MQFCESHNVETHRIRQDKVSLTKNRAAAHASCSDQSIWMCNQLCQL